MVDLAPILERLETLGHRATAERRAVLAAIVAAGPYVAPEELVSRLPHVGRATIFRTLKLLVETRVLCRVLMEDGSLRYRLSLFGHHHHLVCSSCGRVQDMASCSLADLVEQLSARTGFTIEGHWLEFYGRCQRCARRVQATA